MPSPHPMAGVSRFIVLALAGRAPRLLVTLETSANLGGREEGGRIMGWRELVGVGWGRGGGDLG